MVNNVFYAPKEVKNWNCVFSIWLLKVSMYRHWRALFCICISSNLCLWIMNVIVKISNRLFFHCIKCNVACLEPFCEWKREDSIFYWKFFWLRVVLLSSPPSMKLCFSFSTVLSFLTLQIFFLNVLLFLPVILARLICVCCCLPLSVPA